MGPEREPGQVHRRGAYLPHRRDPRPPARSRGADAGWPALSRLLRPRLEGRRLCDRDAATEPAAGTAPSTPAERGEDGLFLFTTKTCPNCSIAKRELEKAGIAYQVMDVNEHRELVARYGIQQAPTLIVRHGEQVEKLVNASTIKKFATSQSV